jgi:hypothetical protein
MFEWFVNDVAGIVCSAFTYFLVLYSQFVIVSVVLLPDPIVSETIQVTNIISHHMVDPQFTGPGKTGV